MEVNQVITYIGLKLRSMVENDEAFLPTKDYIILNLSINDKIMSVWYMILQQEWKNYYIT